MQMLQSGSTLGTYWWWLDIAIDQETNKPLGPPIPDIVAATEQSENLQYVMYRLITKINLKMHLTLVMTI